MMFGPSESIKDSGRTLLGLSWLVTIGLLIAWIVTTCIGASKLHNAQKERASRREFLAPIIGRRKVAKMDVQEAVKDGSITPEMGEAISEAIDQRGSSAANQLTFAN